jgi:hypothetical protein
MFGPYTTGINTLCGLETIHCSVNRKTIVSRLFSSWTIYAPDHPQHLGSWPPSPLDHGQLQQPQPDNVIGKHYQPAMSPSHQAHGAHAHQKIAISSQEVKATTDQSTPQATTTPAEGSNQGPSDDSATPICPCNVCGCIREYTLPGTCLYCQVNCTEKNSTF